MSKFIALTLLLITSLNVSAQKTDALIINLQQLKKDNWTQQEFANARLITDFVQNLMNNHNFDYVLSHYNDSSYTQHNTTATCPIK